MTGTLEAAEAIIDGERQAESDWRQSLRKRLGQIAIRDYLGEQNPEDAESLAALLADLEMSGGHYQRLVEQCGKVVALASRHVDAKAICETEVCTPAEQREVDLIAGLFVDLCRKLRSGFDHAQRQVVTLPNEIKSMAEAFPELFTDGEPPASLTTAIQANAAQRAENRQAQHQAIRDAAVARVEGFRKREGLTGQTVATKLGLTKLLKGAK